MVSNHTGIAQTKVTMQSTSKKDTLWLPWLLNSLFSYHFRKSYLKPLSVFFYCGRYNPLLKGAASALIFSSCGWHLHVKSEKKHFTTWVVWVIGFIVKTCKNMPPDIMKIINSTKDVVFTHVCWWSSQYKSSHAVSACQIGNTAFILKSKSQILECISLLGWQTCARAYPNII